MTAGLRLLEYEPSLVPEGGCQILGCLAGLVKAEKKDAAGHSFHQFALLQKGLIKLPEDDDDDEEEESSDSTEDQQDGKLRKLQNEEPPEGTQWKKAKKKKRNVKKSTSQDLYALLGLANERWTATESQITKAYRKVALTSHPDKISHACEDDAAKQRVEEKFLLIQEAYEVLSNPTLRREYDSTDDFDDTLPSECSPDDFFKVFGPAFRRNSRWSTIKPVPELGDLEIPWNKVESFYDFWFGFKSWREFPHPDEEDVASAECRDHRRWMERQNSKLREKSKKEEARRLREFVESAYKIDPRVSQRKDAQKQARLQRKQEKAEARRKAEQEDRERIQKREAEKLAKEQAEKDAAREARRLKEEEEKALNAAKDALEVACGTENGKELLDEGSLYMLRAKLNLEQLTKLTNFLVKTKDNPNQCKKVLKKAVEDLEREEQEAIKLRRDKLASSERAIRDAREQELEKKKKQMSEWTQEELRMLDKALKKFPQGTRKRWEQVAAYLGSRTMDEVLQMVKEKKGAASKKFESQENFRSGHKKKATVGGEPTQSDSFTENENLQSSSSKVAVSSETGAWTEEQELALVKALKAFPRDVDQRWDKICEVVPEKTKAQCFKRFKELRETFRANKVAS